MEKSGIGAMKATEQAMKEISGAIIAITLVMSAVFIPVAFMSGPSGIFYRQFSLTMAVAIVLSGVIALTLTPALCAMLLKNPHQQHKKKNKLTRFYDGFNEWYNSLSKKYQALLGLIANRRVITFSILLIFCFGTGLLGRFISSGFIPNEDQGTFYASITTPSGSTLERTKAVVNEVQKVCEEIDAIESVSSLAGTNILSDGTGATYGTCLINLKSWDNRKESVDDIIALVVEKTNHIKDAKIEFFPPPAVPGYGNASGFELRLLDKTGRGDFKEMEKVVNQFMSDLKARPEIASAFTIFDASYPQFMLYFDNDMAAKKGVTVNNAMGTLQTLLGSEYATNFIRFGQMYKVMVQALPQYRAKPDDILKLTVKNDKGEMVPLSAFMSVEKMYGVDQITRYNMYPSAELNGEAAEGFSSGNSIAAIQEVAKTKLPKGYDSDWAGITRDEVQAGNEAIYIFIICLLFVYLVLAAQYESFLLPMPVILSLPTGIFGAFLMLMLMGLENNIYAQVAMIMLIGLLGKNAILIVEFARELEMQGATAFKAAVEASRLRLRPILMTSIAFIMGVVPLVTSTGAGSEMRHAMGIAVFFGMIGVTLFGLFLTPAFYVLIRTLNSKHKLHSAAVHEAPLSTPHDH
jgi:HAE1 family hydrophobic/amphiphilic exporter-1